MPTAISAKNASAPLPLPVSPTPPCRVGAMGTLRPSPAGRFGAVPVPEFGGARPLLSASSSYVESALAGPDRVAGEAGSLGDVRAEALMLDDYRIARQERQDQE